MSNDFLWVEKYRPTKVEETILPKRLKSVFTKMIKDGEIPNMMFSGSAGTGKTTVAKALCNELQLDYIVINASESGNIDTLRGKIKQFASSVSLSGGIKVVILDEADYLNPQSTQPALRGFIEEFANNCRFIMTCNFKNRIIEPLHSRCSVYDFSLTKKEKAEMAAEFFKRFTKILDNEEVEYNQQSIVNLVMKHAPDWRRVLNEGQRLSNGEHGIHDSDSGFITNFDTLSKSLKEKNFKDMRSWVAQNVDLDATAIFRGIYDNMNKYVQPNSIPQLVLILADYQYKDAFVADKELNTVACLTEIMAQIQFK
jgi:DNA polymerase III delta prime subunit